MDHWLFNMVKGAFAHKSAAQTTDSSKKRRPFADEDTGPGAAGEYRLKHPRGIRQLCRMQRIAAGLRPLKYEVLGKRERAVARKARTK